METITVICDKANITSNGDETVSVDLIGINLSDILNEVSLETGLQALIDAHDFSQVFDAIIALHNEAQDEN